jgi:hypothetical protein
MLTIIDTDNTVYTTLSTGFSETNAVFSEGYNTPYLWITATATNIYASHY